MILIIYERLQYFSESRRERRLHCFPANSTVITDSGVIKPLSALERGEYVLTVSKRGQPLFRPVITFLHIDRKMKYTFFHICTLNNTCLTVSGDHLIFKLNGNFSVRENDSLNFVEVIFAKRIALGDYILVYSTNNMHFTPEIVVSIQPVISDGLFAPLTTEGSIVVDRVAASCYAGVYSDSLAHIITAPLRLLYKLFSSNFNVLSFYSNDGIHWYAALLLWLADLLDLLKLFSFIDG